MPTWTQNVSKSAQNSKILHFWSVWLQHVFGLFSASRRFASKFDPSKSFSTLQGIDLSWSIFHENQVPKSYHCFYVKKWFCLAPCRTKRIHFSQPWFEAFRSSSTLFLFVALSPTSYLTTPTRVRPYSTWLVIYSSFCAPTGVKKGRKQQKSDGCVYTPRIPWISAAKPFHATNSIS